MLCWHNLHCCNSTLSSISSLCALWLNVAHKNAHKINTLSIDCLFIEKLLGNKKFNIRISCYNITIDDDFQYSNIVSRVYFLLKVHICCKTLWTVGYSKEWITITWTQTHFILVSIQSIFWDVISIIKDVIMWHLIKY